MRRVMRTKNTGCEFYEPVLLSEYLTTQAGRIYRFVLFGIILVSKDLFPTKALREHSQIPFAFRGG